MELLKLDGFLSIVLRRFLKGQIPPGDPEEIFAALNGMDENDNLFITICPDPDGTCRITGPRALDVCYKILEAAIGQHRADSAGEAQYGLTACMKGAVSFIEEHLQDEDLSVISAAAAVYLSPAYFGRVFKQTFHRTFRQYVLGRRMERARDLLTQKDASISFVCEQVGISSPSYFSHLFKQYTGLAPSEYKKSKQGQAGSNLKEPRNAFAPK